MADGEVYDPHHCHYLYDQSHGGLRPATIQQRRRMKMSEKFKFGDKVHDWIDDKEYIVVGKSRGKFYKLIDSKEKLWKINQIRLKRGWKTKKKQVIR